MLLSFLSFVFDVIIGIFAHQAVHSGKGLQWDGVAYTPVVYQEKPSVEADIRSAPRLSRFSFPRDSLLQ